MESQGKSGKMESQGKSGNFKSITLQKSKSIHNNKKRPTLL